MYDELIKRLREPCKYENCVLCQRAADAIEELSMRLHGDEAAIVGMKREIERMVVAGKPRWIPVAERFPERFKSVLTVDKYGVITFNWISGDGKNWSTGYHITHWMPLPEPPKEET